MHHALRATVREGRHKLPDQRARVALTVQADFLNVVKHVPTSQVLHHQCDCLRGLQQSQELHAVVPAPKLYQSCKEKH